MPAGVSYRLFDRLGNAGLPCSTLGAGPAALNTSAGLPRPSEAQLGIPESGGGSGCRAAFLRTGGRPGALPPRRYALAARGTERGRAAAADTGGRGRSLGACAAVAPRMRTGGTPRAVPEAARAVGSTGAATGAGPGRRGGVGPGRAGPRLAVLSGWSPVPSSGPHRGRGGRPPSHLAAAGLGQRPEGAPAARSGGSSSSAGPRAAERASPGRGPSLSLTPGGRGLSSCSAFSAGRHELVRRLGPSVPTAPAFQHGEEAAPERARSVTRCVTRAVRGGGRARAPGAAQPPPLWLRRQR